MSVGRAAWKLETVGVGVEPVDEEVELKAGGNSVVVLLLLLLLLLPVLFFRRRLPNCWERFQFQSPDTLRSTKV